MARRQIIPAVMEFGNFIFEQLNTKLNSGLHLSLNREKALAVEYSENTELLFAKVEVLENALEIARNIEDIYEKAKYYKDEILPAMADLRKTADSLEYLTGGKYWPVPNYAHLLFDV